MNSGSFPKPSASLLNSEESRRSQATATETMEAKEIATTAVAETAVAEAPAQVFDMQSCKRAAQTPRPFYILEA